MTARWITADVHEGLATLDDASVDLVVTSPPFLALRSYLPADHPDKGKEIGSEPTPAAFIDVMLAVTAELRRVLAPHGSICIELGDTYAGSGGAGGDYSGNPAAMRQDQPKFDGSAKAARQYQGMTKSVKPGTSQRLQSGVGWPLSKSLALIPRLYQIALAYGINPLTGAESPAGRWRVRNVVTWCRPNPPVGALGDKWRPATSDIVIACTSDKRYWDDIATRRESTPENAAHNAKYAAPGGAYDKKKDGENLRDDGYWADPGRGKSLFRTHTNGAPLLDYWELPPGGYPGSHYAVYPPALVEPLIKAMAPPKVCETCGEPSRRIVDYSRPIEPDDRQRKKHANGQRPADGRQDRAPEIGWEMERTTLGWSDCGHNTWRQAHILDPFAGSGTTLSVATGHGHNATGIDLDPRNRDLALERIGPFLFEEATP